MFTSYLYSGGIPLLNCTCFVYLIIIYFTDKFLVLRHFRSPPSYNHELYISALKCLPYSIIFHGGVSLYMYGNYDIFPISASNNSTIRYIFGDNIGPRIERPSGIFNCFLIVVGLLMVFLLNFLDLVCGSCLRKVSAFSRTSVNLKDIQEDMRNIGLDTYDIKNNPSYAMIINAMDESAVLDEETNKVGYFDVANAKSSTSRHETGFQNVSVDQKIPKEEQISLKDQDIEGLSESDSEPEFSRDTKDEVQRISLKQLRKTNSDIDEQVALNEDQSVVNYTDSNRDNEYEDEDIDEEHKDNDHTFHYSNEDDSD